MCLEGQEVVGTGSGCGCQYFAARRRKTVARLGMGGDDDLLSSGSGTLVGSSPVGTEKIQVLCKFQEASCFQSELKLMINSVFLVLCFILVRRNIYTIENTNIF